MNVGWIKINVNVYRDTNLANGLVNSISASGTQNSRWDAVSFEEIRGKKNTVCVNTLR